MNKIFFVILSILVLSSCIEKKRRDLETPCVAVEFGSDAEGPVPCVRVPVNKNWQIG